MTSPYSRLLVAVLSITLFGTSCNPVTSVPPPQAGSWLVLLCKASDAPQEPHPVSYYEELFSKQQVDFLYTYFDVVSNHTLDVSGSQVFGWFTMSVNTATIAPDVRNNAMPVTRGQTANDCKAAALGGLGAKGLSVDPSNYSGVITVINVPTDPGEAGGKSVVVSYHPEGEIGFLAHEMLHVLGLRHSNTAAVDVGSHHRWKNGGDEEYNDCWDMMSFRTCVFGFQTNRGLQGPELQGSISGEARLDASEPYLRKKRIRDYT
jgi:hypothetical protein